MVTTRIKILSIAMITVSFLVLSTTYTRSQTPGSDEYNEYTSQLEEYQRAHNQYVLARSNYLRFRTLASEEDAIDATKQMLLERDEVVVAYANLLIEEAQGSIGLEQAIIDELILNLERERDWFSQHDTQVRSAATLPELVTESQAASSQFNTFNSYAYVVFSYISYGKVSDFQTRLVDVYGDLRRKFDTIRNDSREDYSFSNQKLIRIDNWLVESQSSISRSQEVLDGTFNRISNSRSGSSRTAYTSVVNQLQDARVHMQQATSFMEEVLREIKTQE